MLEQALQGARLLYAYTVYVAAPLEEVFRYTGEPEYWARDFDGNPLPNAPKWIANVTARYSVAAGNDGEYSVSTDWAYRSETSFFLYRSAEFTGKPLLEGGMAAGYSWRNGAYEIAVFGRNITNQVRVTGGIDFNNLTGFINDPRTYGVQFRAMF